MAVIGYLDQGGKGIIQASLDSGAFDKFILSDGMIGQSLVDAPTFILECGINSSSNYFKIVIVHDKIYIHLAIFH